MWIPYNLLSPLKAESPKATISASEAATNERTFVVGFFLRNPATRSWECDILVPGGDERRKLEIGGRQGTVHLSANSTGKLEQIIYTLPATSADCALAACYSHVIRRLDGMILQYGRGIEIAGWQIADVEHDARWRCVPFRPSSLMPLPDLRELPQSYDDVMRLYREARCATSAQWRLICAGAILNAAIRGKAPFKAEPAKREEPVVTTDMLIRSGAIVAHADLKGATLEKVRDRIEPHRQALLTSMMSSAEGEDCPLLITSNYEMEASLAALANLADLIARDLILENLRADGYLETSTQVGREPLELSGQLAGMS